MAVKFVTRFTKPSTIRFQLSITGRMARNANDAQSLRCVREITAFYADIGDLLESKLAKNEKLTP